MTSSATREAVLAFAEYLLDSDFAEVLGAGIGALYGLLPSKLVLRTTSDGGQQASEVMDGVAAKTGGMQLGGMGALGEDENAEELERKREEEEDRLKSMGVGLSGTNEMREGMDGFLKLVEFTQEVLKRCAPTRRHHTDDEGAAVDDLDELRQRELLLSALTDSVLTSVRDLFLQSVLYPSILECSDTDGSAVAVMSYIDALLDVVKEGTTLEGAILGFLLGEEESPLDRPKRPSTASSPRHSSKMLKPRKSSALLLIEQSSSARHDSSSYFTSFGRFSLQDLLTSNLRSSSQSTTAAALNLLQTILTKHDRWSLALLDVVLDEGATSFPLAKREVSQAEDLEDDDSDDDDSPFVYRSSEPMSTTSSADDFNLSSSRSSSTHRLPDSTSTLRPLPSAHATPAKPSRLEFGTPLPSTPSVSLHLDHLDTLLSLVSAIDPTYRQTRLMGGGSEMLSSGFANYLKDAESSLAADRGFRRGVVAEPNSEDQPFPQSRRRSTLFGTESTLRGRDYALAKTGWRHKMKPNGEVLSLVLESFAHFFSHSPDVNLALTAVVATLATYPYRSLEGWLLPIIRQQQDPSDFEQYLRDGPARHPLSDDGDDRSIDFGIEERSRQSALLSPLPRNPSSYDPSNPPPSATRAAIAQSDSLLAILDALVKSVEQYRSRIPKFDVYLSERRQGLFFVENLADALHLDDLETPDNSFSSPEPAQPISLPPATPVSKPKPSGLASFFSPRRPSHSRSPSTPLNKSFSTPQQSSAPPRSSQLRRSASTDSLTPASPSRLTAPSSDARKAAGTASPFVTHYRQTGSIKVQPVIVSTPVSSRRSNLAPPGDEDDEPTVEEGAPDSPSRRLSPLPPPPASTTSSSTGSPSTSIAIPPSKPRETPVVTLSTILDNVIVLEEFIKELASIIFVRRSVGIDSIRFV